jgi:DNA-binding CsgD family transcriptional regulator
MVDWFNQYAAPMKLEPIPMGKKPHDVPPPRGLTAERMRVRGTEHVVLSFPLDVPEIPRTLTTAERAVALLVIEGRTDAEIAVARGVSKRTIGNQIASIFRKLGVGSRVELAARLVGGDG